MIANPFYQVAELRRYAKALGWAAAVRLRLSDALTSTGVSKPKLLELKPGNAKFPLSMRTHTSDRQVLRQIFIELEYAAIDLQEPRVILDLGANVGYSSAYFLSKYPTATVLAVEPDPGNYGICCRNLSPFGERAKVLLGAAWPERRKLVLDKGTYRDGRDWATRVTAPKEASTLAEVEAYDLPSLLDLCRADEIDLLKIDIEGSEIELFSRGTERWLPRARNFCIELHDQSCADIFFRAISDYSYNLSRIGDLTICLNMRPGAVATAKS